VACRAHMGRKGEPTPVETPPPPPSTEEVIPLLLLRRFAVVSYSVSVSPSSSSSSSYKNKSKIGEQKIFFCLFHLLVDPEPDPIQW
jgi:hypothetical protein